MAWGLYQVTRVVDFHRAVTLACWPLMMMQEVHLLALGTNSTGVISSSHGGAEER